ELERRDSVPSIQKDAVVTRNDKPFAFAVADGIAALRPLELGLADDKRVEVKSGLQAGEDVVISGQASLRDKDPVRIVQPGAVQRPAGQPGQPGQGGQPGAAAQGGQGTVQQGQRPAGTPAAGQTAGQAGQAGQGAAGAA